MTSYIYLLERIEQAFGPNGLGIIQVTNVPSQWTELRRAVLQRASKLAHLSKDQLEALTVPNMDYTIGWSHGKEQFGVDDQTGQPLYDTRKGSFYFNPFDDIHVGNNVFPPQEQFPLFEQQLLQLTQAMTELTLWIAQLCDAYLQWKDATSTTTTATSTTTTTTPTDTTCSSSSSSSSGNNFHGSIYHSLQSKLNTKARLLYYYAVPESTRSSDRHPDHKTDDDWCGWHKDHGSLTALLPGMLLDESSYRVVETTIPAMTSSTTNRPPGLYIQTRSGSQVAVTLPPTSVGIQLGETLELMSGGKLMATPHAVKSGSTGSGNARLARASLAVFVQPLPNQTLPDCPITADESLRFRYRTTFGAFQQATTKAFQ
jgi:hypothetical protein